MQLGGCLLRLFACVLLCAALAGCVVSRAPLFDAASEAVTPLPAHLVLTDKKATPVTLTGNRYAYATDAQKTSFVSFYDIGLPGFFLLQLESQDSSGKPVEMASGYYALYALGRLGNGTLAVYTIPDAAEIEARLGAGNVPHQRSDVLFAFEDKAALVAGMRALAASSKLQSSMGAGFTLPAPPEQAEDFPVEGYTDTDLMKQIYDGDFDKDTVPPAPVYAQEFMQMFANTDECRSLVDASSFTKITAIAAGRLAGDLLGLNQQGMPQMPQTHNLDEILSQAFQGGAQTMGRGAQLTQRADADAQLFYDRHGCQSPVAERFFRNLNHWIDLMGG